MHADVDTLERFDWDPTVAGAFLLGKHTLGIASTESRMALTAIANGSLTGRNAEQLVDDVRAHDSDQYDRIWMLVDAFFHALNP